MVELATEADIPSWLMLVREVEPLFGPMPAFDITLRNKIAEGSAFCVRDGAVLGGVLVGGAAPDHWIRWLAVRATAREQGVGGALVAAVLARCPPPCTISLATFGADNPEGRPARRLYERLGFEAHEILPRGPEGGTRQKYVLVRA
ncbi:MAG: GNAT family N-acetyltransferase [Proteobacteria bacterium]|nr:GNAT family N-acetyltransferase [Pseudomonadota bacterium]